MRSLKTQRKSIALDWGHFIVLNSIMGFCIWYFFDAYSNSKSISNMIFIAPATVVVSFLYLLILPSLILKKEAAKSKPIKEIVYQRIIIPSFLVLAFAIFISSIERIGIDIASYLFLSVSLYICGERNWIILLILPPVTSIALVLSFRSMIPYPLPTALL